MFPKGGMMKRYLYFILALALAACSAQVDPIPPTGPVVPGRETPNEPDPTPAGGQEQTAEVEQIRSNLERASGPALTQEQLTELVSANNTFALELYRQAIQANRNLIFSPYSISSAFSMVYAGAKGQTESELTAGLHFLPQDQHHALQNALDQDLTALPEEPTSEEEGDPFTLKIANSIWGQQGFHFETAYLDILAQYYGGGVGGVYF
jgi:serpin B